MHDDETTFAIFDGTANRDDTRYSYTQLFLIYLLHHMRGLRLPDLIDRELRIARERNGHRETRARADQLHLVHVLGARRERRDATALRLDDRVRLVFGPVDEDEPAAGELALVAAQIQQRRVVERLVRVLVDVRMPVLVVQRLCRCVGDAREECGRGQMQGIDGYLEVLGDGSGYALLDVLCGQKPKIG